MNKVWTFFTLSIDCIIVTTVNLFMLLSSVEVKTELTYQRHGYFYSVMFPYMLYGNTRKSYYFNIFISWRDAYPLDFVK
jgi:hypothetical protein